MTDFAAARHAMVENQIRTYDVFDSVLLAGFEQVPREAFVDPAFVAVAYSDMEIPARGGRKRLVAPMVLARMMVALELNRGEKVLDVGGAGYGAAILRAVGVHVTAVDDDAASANASLAAAGITDLKVIEGNLADGYPSGGPYGAILVHGAAEVKPDKLLNQLKEEGGLAIVMGQGRSARATLFKRIGRTCSSARIFDATAPLLPEFRHIPEFQF